MAETDHSSAVSDIDRITSKCRQLSQRVYIQSQRAAGEWDAIRAEVDSVTEGIRVARKQAESLADTSERELLLFQLSECDQILRTGPGGDIRGVLKTKHRPLLLSILVGRHVPLRAEQRKDAFKIKQEYHAFRSSVQAFLVFMLYVYLSIAAREGILLLNGSSIRPWWIKHHYLSALTCIIMLTLPVDSPAVQRYIEGWLQWTVVQAALMLAQNQYQQKRMYTRIALGKNSALDVVGGESSGMPGQLLALLPFLFALQGWQVFMGANMMLQAAPAMIEPEGWLDMERHETDLRGLRGTFAVGLLMMFMGLGNAWNTIGTVVGKRKAAKKLKAYSAQVAKR